MSTQDRRDRERESRRQTIIDAAEKLFFSKGLQATMDDIAAEADVAKGTIYLHFSCKEELYVLLMCKGLDMLRDLFKSVIAQGGSVVETVQRVGLVFIRFHDEHPDFFHLIHDVSHAIPEVQVSPHVLASLHESSSALWTLLAEVLQRGIDQGVFRNDISAFEMAIILWTSSSGMLRQIDAMRMPSLWRSTPSQYSMRLLDFNRLLTLMGSIVLKGLEKPPE